MDDRMGAMVTIRFFNSFGGVVIIKQTDDEMCEPEFAQISQRRMKKLQIDAMQELAKRLFVTARCRLRYLEIWRQQDVLNSLTSTISSELKVHLTHFVPARLGRANRVMVMPCHDDEKGPPPHSSSRSQRLSGSGTSCA